MKYSILFLLIFLTSCSNIPEAKENSPNQPINVEESTDRTIGKMNIDTFKKYSNLAMNGIIIKVEKNKLIVCSKLIDSSKFYVNILGQPIYQMVELINSSNSENKNKWRPLKNNDSLYGFEADYFEVDKNFAYIPFEILININAKRQLNKK